MNLFSFKGRITRGRYWAISVGIFFFWLVLSGVTVLILRNSGYSLGFKLNHHIGNIGLNTELPITNNEFYNKITNTGSISTPLILPAGLNQIEIDLYTPEFNANSPVLIGKQFEN